MDERLSALYTRVDAFFAAAVQASPQAFACRAGCDSCCRYDLTIFRVEAETVQAAFQALPEAARDAIVWRARAGATCVFRDPQTGCCDIYAARPLICRTHGLTVMVEGRLDACMLNYRDGWPPREHVLDVERVNEPLAVINRIMGFDGQRASLRDLVLEEGSDD